MPMTEAATPQETKMGSVSSVGEEAFRANLKEFSTPQKRSRDTDDKTEDDFSHKDGSKYRINGANVINQSEVCMRESPILN